MTIKQEVFRLWLCLQGKWESTKAQQKSKGALLALSSLAAVSSSKLRYLHTGPAGGMSWGTHFLPLLLPCNALLHPNQILKEENQKLTLIRLPF